MIYEASYGDGKFRICGTAIFCGNDVSMTLLGGTHPHVGAASVAVYEPARNSATVSTISVYSHRDDVCTSRCAKKVSINLRCTACVSAGIHIDGAVPQDLQTLLGNVDLCCDDLITQMKNQPAYIRNCETT